MLQLLLFAFSAAAIWLVSCESQRAVRWGFLIGLAGQPFWLVETWQAGQGGIFALSLFYTLAWGRGVIKHWFRRIHP